jgi:bacteriorhodopsin
MAHLEVQPRKRNPAWIWLILGLVVIAAILFLLMRSSNNTRPDAITNTDSISGNVAPAADTAGARP